MANILQPAQQVGLTSWFSNFPFFTKEEEYTLFDPCQFNSTQCLSLSTDFLVLYHVRTNYGIFLLLFIYTYMRFNLWFK